MRRRRVLVIDDDPDFRASVKAMLEPEDYVVSNAATGAEGLEAVRRLQPDVILLDVMMEERTAGFFLLRELRRIPALSGIPVIVISAIYADNPRFRTHPEPDWLPADLFLPKPVEPDRLRREIRRLLARRESRAAARHPVGLP
jgi:CheY-like chemotaxis protein